MGVRCVNFHLTTEHILAGGRDDQKAALMSDKVRAWVWKLDLPPARKLILLWLAGRATDNGVAFPGEREIREKTGLGERMVRYHLQALADRNEDEPPATPGPFLQRIERRVRADR